MDLNIHSHTSVHWWEKKNSGYITKFQPTLHSGESFCIIKSRWGGPRNFQNFTGHYIYDLDEPNKRTSPVYCELNVFKYPRIKC